MSADILAQSTDANEVTITVLETETSTISQLGQIYQNDIQDWSGQSPADISNQVNFVSI